MKKVLSVVFLIVGTIIGAGFASGREISVFFARFGIYSLFFMPFLFILLYFIFKLFLNIGRHKNFDNIFELNNFTNNSIFMNTLISFTFLIFSSAMFSGAVEILSNNFINIPSIIFYLIIFLICYFVLKSGFKGLIKVNVILVPILIISILCLCIYATFSPVCEIEFIPQSSGVIGLPFSILIYATGNILLSYFLLVKAGKGLDEKQIKKVSLISSLIICSVIFVCIVCLIKNGSAILDCTMPFIALSLRLGEGFYIAYVLVVLVGILSTLFSGIFTASQSLKVNRHRDFICLSLVLALSFLGFKEIVDNVYPILGIIGIFVILRFMFAYRSFLKSGFQPCHHKVHKPCK